MIPLLWTLSCGPRPPSVALATPRTDAAFWAGETVTLDVRADGLDGAVFLLKRADTAQWWDADAATWTDTVTALPAAGTVTPALSADDPTAVDLTVIAADSLATIGAPLATSTTTVRLLARRWLWGDLHGHSDLSQDGCSDPDDGCIAGPDGLAQDFFDGPRAEGQDFGAMTDHAEYRTWRSADGGTDVDVWTRQQEVVADANTDDFIALLGFEWTRGATEDDITDYWPGGHRTIVFEDAAVCEDARIASHASRADDIYVKAEAGSQLLGGTPVFAPLWPDVLTTLHDALKTCKQPGRVLLVPHHPAWVPPSPVDWTNPDNQLEDPGFARLVEIYSEHGDSECADPAGELCNWRHKEAATYIVEGAVQTALMQGLHLGIIAGTDSHDGHGGTLDDDPSCTAILDPDTGALRCQDHPGGLAGVMVADPGDRAALFDAFFARHTVGTSYPRLPVRAFVQSDDGSLRLPGDGVPVGGTARLVVSVEGLVDDAVYDTVAIDLIDADGHFIAQADGPVLDTLLSPSAGDIHYARLRFYAPDDTEGERMWLSPWYFE